MKITPNKISIVKESNSEKHECEHCKWLRGNVTWVGRPPLCDKHRHHPHKIC